MNRTNLVTLAALMFVGLGCAQFAAGADLCTGGIDPYDIVSEKGRFYAAAGKDNELSSTEFGANKISSTSFRRSFDRWSEMLKFDRDANKSLDWMEAGAYRYAMRRMVLAAYDANRDGKLAGAERLAACKAVASGKIRFPTKPAFSPPPLPPPPKSHSDKSKSYKSSSSKYSKSYSSGSSDAERKARMEAQQREAEKRRKEYEARRDLARYDKNKDGKLDGNELAAKNKYHDEMKSRMSESKKRHEEMMRKYDSNRNGRIDDDEKKALKEGLRQEAAKRAAANKEASKKRMEEYQRRKEFSKYDRNKNGRLDPEEAAALNEYRAEQKRRMDEYLKKYDTNGDGQVSVEEKARYRKQHEEEERAKKIREKEERDKHKKDSDKHKSPKSKSMKKAAKKSR